LSSSAIIAAMSIDGRRSISITLSPVQVEEVVRAAAGNRTPTVATLIGNSLAPPTSTGAGADGAPRASLPPLAAASVDHAGIDDIDPRLSRSLMRGLSILAGFTSGARERGIVELASELGLSPSTTHRYAQTLLQLGLLERCPTTRKYRLPTR
jgi:hypothetical protein